MKIFALHVNVCLKYLNDTHGEFEVNYFSRLKQQLCDLKNSENGVKVLNIFSQTSKCPQKKVIWFTKKKKN